MTWVPLGPSYRPSAQRGKARPNGMRHLSSCVNTVNGTRSGAVMSKHARLSVEEYAVGQQRTRVRRAPRLRTRYYAFLSYSHDDEEIADWLHRELEKFRVPHALTGR